ncbi:MAG: hypothetical protein JXM69_11085 [Anaerolineae bacterium]|nr:hypothetical protein [Anaerolineae bacterium]
MQTTFWLRRVAHWSIRAAWLALLVPTIWMAGYLWLGWNVRWYHWVIPMLLVGIGSMLWSIRPVNIRRVVRRLDDRLELQTRLTTAFEISHREDNLTEVENPVTERLMAESEDIANTLRHAVPLVNRTLWVEMQALIAVAALLAALLMIDSLAPRVPHTAPVDLPATWQEPTAKDVLSEESQLAQSIAPEDVGVEPMHEEDFDKALKILADVFRDHAVTHAIAVAIDNHNLSQAAAELRRLADELDDLSPQARAELGDLQQEAADKIGNIAPSITKPLQDGSTALDNDDLIGAGQALEELAAVLDSIQDSPAEVAEYKPVEQETINQPNPVELEQQQLAPEEQPDDNPLENELEEQAEQPTEEERLSMEGDPMELESDAESEEKVVQEADPDAEASDAETQDAPFTKQPLYTPNQELGADRLTYPWEKREVIRRYFTP